jgi:hypothetical protein
MRGSPLKVAERRLMLLMRWLRGIYISGAIALAYKFQGELKLTNRFVFTAGI